MNETSFLVLLAGLVSIVLLQVIALLRGSRREDAEEAFRDREERAQSATLLLSLIHI